jgi:DNA repair protein RecO (recombination protein O)
MQRVKLTGVVVRAVNYGESDRIVSLLTEERGKLSAFARGARASRRRFGGALEPFTLVAVEARERRGSDLLDLESASVVRGFGGIRDDLAAIACAGYACELARELVRDAEPHAELLAVLLRYLTTLDGAPARPDALRAFELAALQATGLMPRLHGCARCGAPLPSLAAEGGAQEGLDGGSGPARGILFVPGEGGVVCSGCAPAASPSSTLSLGAVAAMGRLQRLGASAEAGIPAGLGAEIRDALSSFIEHHLGRRLASRKFLDEIAPMLGSSASNSR